MKVSNLIAELRKCPSDFDVSVEGFDDSADADHIEIVEVNREVMICRE
jgi:hypothetical protein